MYQSSSTMKQYCLRSVEISEKKSAIRSPLWDVASTKAGSGEIVAQTVQWGNWENSRGDDLASFSRSSCERCTHRYWCKDSLMLNGLDRCSGCSPCFVVATLLRRCCVSRTFQFRFGKDSLTVAPRICSLTPVQHHPPISNDDQILHELQRSTWHRWIHILFRFYNSIMDAAHPLFLPYSFRSKKTQW